MRTLRFIGMAIIAVIMSVNFTACSDDDGDEVIFVLSEEDKTMQFTDEGGEKNISFKLNSEEWHSYPTDKAVNWVSYTPQEGNRGDNTVTFKVLRNIGPSRNYSVTFSSQYNRYDATWIHVVINQQGTDDTSGVYTIELEAGTLPGIISEEYRSSITELTLKGDLNGADILLLRRMLNRSPFYDGALAVLNLADANIVEGGGDYDEAANVTELTSNDEIGDGMFSAGSRDILESIILPNSVKVIGTSAFRDRGNLTTIIIPDNVTTIKEYAFDSCTKLTSLEIGSKVEEIGIYAFWGTHLKEIHIKTPIPPTIDFNTFDSFAYNATLYVPIGSIDTYKSTENWSKFKNIVEE